MSEVILDHAVAHALGVATALAHAALGQSTRYTEVTNLHIAILVDENILRLDVPMKNVGGVQKLHGTS